MIKIGLLICLGVCIMKGSGASPDNAIPDEIKAKMIFVGNNARYGEFTKTYSKRIGANKLPVKYDSKAVEDYLLPRDVTPLTYDIKLIPYLDSSEVPVEKHFTFDGEATIRIQAIQNTNAIVMHALDLTINAPITVTRVSDNSSIGVSGYTILTDNRQFLTINLTQTLSATQQYDIKIIYAGVLNDRGQGFFRSAYTDENGNNKWLTVTQFESTAARQAFPCFDEPNSKANFTIHIARQPGFTAISNMPIQSQGDPVSPQLPGWVWSHFEESVKMSSYLVAFSSNEFLSVGNLPNYQVWSRPEVYLSGLYASQISPQLVAYHESFNGVPYTLPKMDQIGMVDFFSGAMENWGFITYLEPYLLYDPSKDDSEDYQLLSIVISHEIAHQWFGDLVSPIWWSTLWLNEGFATYFENFATVAIGPDWQLQEQFLVDTLQYALRSDADESRPIYQMVDTPASINTMFDSISYQKGGCIVHFMVNFLGEANFRQGINAYLNGMAFKAANQSDLFNYLALYAPAIPNQITFQQLMESWTLQAGFPLLTVTRNYGTQTATISQNRFGFNGTEKWIIPITAASGDAPNFSDLSAKGWLLPSDTSITLGSTIVPGQNSWFIINNQLTAFYRVNYDDTNWGLIANALTANANIIHEGNRIQIMDDALVLASYGLLNYDVALRTTNYLGQETRLSPWKVATYNLEYPRDRVYQDLSGVNNFRRYISSRINTVYTAVNGFTETSNDPLGMKLTRAIILRWACDSLMSRCLTDGFTLFESWRNSANPNNNTIGLDIRDTTYCAGQRNGGSTSRNFLLSQYQQPGIPSRERDRLIFGMGCTSNLTLLQQLLQWTLDGTISANDALTGLFAVYSHPEGLELALDFLITNWQALNTIYGDVGLGFISISDKLNTVEHLNKLNTFLNDNSASLGVLTISRINSAIATVESIIAWNTQNLQTVLNYFQTAP